MKLLKLFLFVSFTLVSSINIFAQVAVDIPISVKDNSGDLWIINFGLDLSATNGIDPSLGEYDGCFLGPPPLFYACWSLPPFPGFLSSPKDYRAPGNPPAFPFNGTIQYSIIFVPTNYPITIIWNLPPEIAPTSTIQDIWGGSLINKPFWGYDSLVITNTTISQLYVFVDYNNIVPVELISFTASVLQNEKAVQLNWTTATETNNSGFEINRKKLEARSKESEWENIGFVPGFGTITEPKTYTFRDDNITNGIYKYRLKQIDFDGSFEYSNEIEVEVDFTPKEFVLYQNYPNPFNPTTTIKFEIPSVETTRRVVFTTLKVYDVLGNEVATLVNEEKQPGVYEVEFGNVGTSRDLSLPSGVYFYELKVGNFRDTNKMILAK
jgi:hypothetical protein